MNEMNAKKIQDLIIQAKYWLGMIRAEINYQRSHQKDAGEVGMETAYWRFHRSIVSGRSVLLSLSTALEANGDNPDDCSELNALKALLEEAFCERSLMDDRIFVHQKKSSLKSFKYSIAKVIEKGRATAWISSVSASELINHGGEINRLYQLLMEGKTSEALLFEAATLERAADRADLFSDKQRSNLRQRSQDVDKLASAEIERLVKQWDAQPFLSASPSVSLEPETPSTKTFPGSVGDGWKCTRCTYQNSATESSCSMCNAASVDAPRPFVEVAKQRGPNFREFKAPPLEPTPAPRIRKGGGYPIWIIKKDVPVFLGPLGQNSKKLKKESGVAYLSVDQDNVDRNGMCPILIKGDPASISKAVSLIETMFTSPKIPVKSESANVQKVFWLSNELVPQLIGHNGSNIKRRTFATGVKTIYADQTKVRGDGQCPVYIEGPPSTVEAAINSLKQDLDSGFGKQQSINAKSNAADPGNRHKKTVWILNADVAELIGPSGKRIQSLIKKYGVESITAWQERVGSDGMCPIVIKGSHEAVVQVATVIEELFCGHLQNWNEATKATTGNTNPTLSPRGSTGPSISPALDPEKGLALVPSVTESGRQPFTLRGQKQLCQPSPKPILNIPMARSSSVLEQQKHDSGETCRVECQPSSKPILSIPMARSNSVLEQQKHASVECVNELDRFFNMHGLCLSCTVADFVAWLRSEDICNLIELAEALSDRDYAKDEMQPNGLKLFKRAALLRAIKDEQEEACKQAVQPSSLGEKEAPRELCCPIGLELMIVDPVVASDGVTYERKHISSWFSKHMTDSSSVISPVTGEPLKDVTLTPNTLIRTMARDFAHRHKIRISLE